MSTAAAKKEKISVPFDYDKYLRKGKLPHIWCPGCGHGIVLKALLRAIDKSAIEKNDICMVSGIGCSSRTPGYVDFNTLHTLHGRALSYATGVKLGNSKLKVIVTTGDGDASQSAATTSYTPAGAISTWSSSYTVMLYTA